MTFEEVKSNIRYMEEHPYIILRKMQISCYSWWTAFKEVEAFVEKHLEDDGPFDSCLNEDEKAGLQAGLMFLPAIMLAEEDEKSWDVYSAIVLLIQNYASMTGEEEIRDIAENLGNLSHMRNSWRTMMIQCESLILQGQSFMNASNVPYNLSRQFISSLLNLEG